MLAIVTNLVFPQWNLSVFIESYTCLLINLRSI